MDGWIVDGLRTEGIEGADTLAERGMLFAKEFFVHCCISGVFFCAVVVVVVVVVELWGEERVLGKRTGCE